MACGRRGYQKAHVFLLCVFCQDLYLIFKVKVILALILRRKAKFVVIEMPFKFILPWISLFPCIRFQPKAIASESLFPDVLYEFAEMFSSLNNVKQLLCNTYVGSVNLKYQWTFDDRTVEMINLSQGMALREYKAILHVLDTKY